MGGRSSCGENGAARDGEGLGTGWQGETSITLGLAVLLDQSRGRMYDAPSGTLTRHVVSSRDLNGRQSLVSSTNCVHDSGWKRSFGTHRMSPRLSPERWYTYGTVQSVVQHDTSAYATSSSRH